MRVDTTIIQSRRYRPDRDRLPDTSRGVYIGWDSQSQFHEFNGVIDDVRIYNRLLSKAEIAALYTERGWPDSQPDTTVALNFEALGDTVICPGDTLDLSLSGNADTYIWNTLDDVVDHESELPRVAPKETTTYEVTALREATPAPCPFIARTKKSITVVVRDAPLAVAGPSTPGCRGDTRRLGGTTSGGTPPYRWQWSPATGLDDPTIERPTATFMDGVNRYTLVVTDANGCRDTSVTTFILLEPPSVATWSVEGVDTARVDTLYYCRGGPGLELYSTAVGTEQYDFTWLPADGLDRADTSHVLASPLDTTRYIVEAIDQGRFCGGYDTVVVIPVDPPRADAGEGRTICVGDSVQLGVDPARDAEHLIYRWRSASMIGDPMVARPIVAPDRTSLYVLEVIDTVTDCRSIDTVEIVVRDIRLDVASTTLDFGLLDGCRSDTTLEITVQNLGADDVRLTSLDDSSDPAVVALLGDLPTIPAGSTVSIPVRFAPPGAGDYTGRLLLRFGPCGDTITIDYTGRRSQSNVSIAPSVLDFGRSADCAISDSTMTVRLTNNGSDPATIEPGLLPSPYRIAAPTLPIDIGAGESVDVEIAYEPTGTGTYTAELRLPFRSGSCTDTLRAQLRASVDEPTLSSDSVQIDFGLLDGCAVEATALLPVTNEGVDDLLLHRIDLPNDITLESRLDRVGAGETVMLRLRWRPTAGGQLDGTILLIFGPCPDTLRIPITGTKQGASFALPDTVDFGTICVGRRATATFSLLFETTGSESGTVTGITVENPFASDITLGQSLPSGSPQSATVSIVPNAVGMIEGRVTLTFDPCDVERTIILRGRATETLLTAVGHDFGTVGLGRPQAGRVRFENTGTDTITIDRIDESGAFGSAMRVVGVSSTLPSRLAPGEMIDVDVEYTAVEGPSTGELRAVVAGPCDTVVAASVLGTGELGSFARLAVDEVSGLPGDRVELVIRIDSSVGLAAASPSRVTGEIVVESSILVVDDGRPTQTNGTERVISFDVPYEPTTDGILLRIPSRILLGRQERSSIDLRAVSFVSTAPIAVETTGSEAILLGLCREGGTRLFDPTGTIAIRRVIPNPARSTLTVDYELSESGDHTMTIVDATGRRVAFIFSGPFVPGRYRRTIDVGTLPSGRYHLVLETPTVRVREGVVVVE